MTDRLERLALTRVLVEEELVGARLGRAVGRAAPSVVAPSLPWSAWDATVWNVSSSHTAGCPSPDTVVADATLLDLLRGLSPEERLRWNDRAAATALELRNAFAAAQSHHAAGAAGSVPDAISLEVEHQPVRVVRLRTLADLKRASTTPKDRLVLATLEDTIRRSGG